MIFYSNLFNSILFYKLLFYSGFNKLDCKDDLLIEMRNMPSVSIALLISLQSVIANSLESKW